MALLCPKMPKFASQSRLHRRKMPRHLEQQRKNTWRAIGIFRSAVGYAVFLGYSGNCLQLYHIKKIGLSQDKVVRTIFHVCEVILNIYMYNQYFPFLICENGKFKCFIKFRDLYMSVSIII